MTTRRQNRARLAQLFAQKLLDEARADEELAWSTAGATDFGKAVAATDRRMKAQCIESLAQARVRADPGGSGAMTATMEGLRDEREALAHAREDAHGAQKGVITRRIKALDRQIHERVNDPDDPEHGVAASLARIDRREQERTDPEGLAIRDQQRAAAESLEAAIQSDPTAEIREAEAAGCTPNVAKILRDGEKVSKATLIEAVVQDAAEIAKGGALPGDFGPLGDPVIASGLLKGYTPKWVGKWLGAGPTKAARKRFDELTAEKA